MIHSALIVAGALSLIASLAHVGIVFGGPSWYRFFGAGERMATLAENKSPQAAITTLGIALVLAVWALYAWSGAGVLPEMPLLRVGLVLITSVYILRGIVGLVAPYVSGHPALAENSKRFWFWSSSICLAIGLTHLCGLIEAWGAL